MVYKMVRLMVLLAVAVVSLSSVVHSSAANVRKLNQPLGEEGKVRKKQLSPDGLSVVYTANQDNTSRTELYSVSLNDGSIIRLNSALSRDVEGFKISPDSTHVVYSAGHTTDQVIQLYSVPIAGGTPIRLTELMENASIDFTISPNSSHVIYDVYPYYSQSTLRNLYSVPILGGSNVQLNTPLVSPQDGIDVYTISPDSTHVVYIRRTVINAVETVWDLYTIAIAGGTPALVDNHVGTALISPDSSQIVYTRTISEPSKPQAIYHVALTGGTPSIYQYSDVEGYPDIYIDSTSTYVVFSIFQLNQVTELYRVPLDGGMTSKINLPLQPNHHVINHRITPDGTRVVYVVGTLPIDPYSNPKYTDLYSVPIAGGTSIKLNGTLDPNGNGLNYGFRISPDSQYVVYKGDQETVSDTLYQLYSVRTDGSTPSVKLNGLLLPADSVYTPDVKNDYMITPDSKGVLYRAETTNFGLADLFSVPINGGAAFKLNDTIPHVISDYGERYQIASNSQDVVFLGVQNPNQNNPTTDLYATKIILPITSVYLPLVQH